MSHRRRNLPTKWNQAYLAFNIFWESNNPQKRVRETNLMNIRHGAEVPSHTWSSMGRLSLEMNYKYLLINNVMWLFHSCPGPFQKWNFSQSAYEFGIVRKQGSKASWIQWSRLIIPQVKDLSHQVTSYRMPSSAEENLVAWKRKEYIILHLLWVLLASFNAMHYFFGKDTVHFTWSFLFCPKICSSAESHCIQNKTYTVTVKQQNFRTIHLLHFVKKNIIYILSLLHLY